jgi:Carboxypeptidase regulatory-like domain
MRTVPRIVLIVIASLLFCGGEAVFAQLRIVGAVSGTVRDPTGATVSQAQVVLRDTKTGLTKEVMSNHEGAFLFPDLASGLYEITVTMAGFQKALVPNIIVNTSQTTDVKIDLQVGQPTETVTVTSGASQPLETSSQIVSNSIQSQTLSQLPVANRSNVLALARLSPGISPPIGGGNSGRYNNLPGGAVNVTVDGINDASNGFKSGGTVLFATVPVRLGAVEEVTVETAGLSADSGAQSGANVKFTTRRGGSDYHGSLFYEPRSERFNANTWSRNAQNLPRTFTRFHDYGGNVGGPLIPFGSWRNKAFFFVNFERSYSPQTNARTVSVLTPQAQQGIYTYIVPGTNQIRTQNVLTLAAGAGAPTAIDPVVKSILDTNNQVPQFAAQIPDTDLNRDTYTWLAENNNYAYFPATRFDFYVTPKQQVTWTWNYRHNWQAGERRLPVPDISRSNPFRLGYFVWSFALQSTLSPKTFNEFRYGVQHSGDSNASASYPPYYTFNDKPLRIGGTLPFGPTVPFIDQQNVTGRHFITTMYDTVTMNRGNHTLTFGFSYRKTDWKDTGEIFQVPTYNLGTPSGDPLPGAIFTSGNFPGINNTLLPNDPAALYNTLTGRVSASNFTRVVDPDTLKYNGFINFTWTRSLMGGSYIQDRWRFSPRLTFNYGLRWEVQGPMHDVKKITAVPDQASLFGPSVSLFTPGVLSGNNNPQVKVGEPAYSTDWLTLAPNFGFAWNPEATKGFLGKLLGGSKTVVRGAYAMVVYDEGTQFYAQNLGTNAGKTISATTLVPGLAGQTNLPRFYSLSQIVANPLTVNNFAFPSGTEYKTVINQADQTFVRTISGFDPTLRAPYTINWNFGIQRELWDNSALEVRYVGTQTHLAWRTSNLNEVNIFENGFLQEFKNAQRNLAINLAAGSNSFANQGRSGQVALPIFDAAFGPRGSLAAIAAGSGYANTAFITNLQNGEAGSLANTLATNQNYVCRMFGNSFSPCLRVQPTANAPGVFPINFFLLNPFVAGRMNYVDDTGWHSYNGLQVEFRQRLRRGLTWNVNYTWSNSLTNLPADNANQSIDFLTLRNTDLDKRPSQFDIRHVIQTYGTYELPFGHGRSFNIDNKILNGVVGGWTIGSVFVFHTGQPLQLTGGFDTVNNTNSTARQGVRLAPGVTLEQIEQMFRAELARLTGRPAGTFTDLQRLAVDPQLIGPDFRANPAFLIPNRTPGEFGQQLFIRDRNNFQWDLSINKYFRLYEDVRLQLFAGFSNILNHPRWAFGDTTGNPPGSLNVFSTSFGVINAPAGNRTMNLRAVLTF